MSSFLPKALLNAAFLLGALRGTLAAEKELPYQACPLMRAYFPPPTISNASNTVSAFAAEFTTVFDDLLQSGTSEDYGAITPNTTSFSIVLFAGASNDPDDAVFFKYHYTAPAATTGMQVGADTVFPVADLTQIFTVYAWLVEKGDTEWQTSITKFLPELSGSANSSGLSVPWNEVTIGALAEHMSGLARDSFACALDEPCAWEAFIEKFASEPPSFLPDTTPMVSNAAFQLLSFALQTNSTPNRKSRDYANILSSAIFQPLDMTNSGLLGSNASSPTFGVDGLNTSRLAEPGALGMISTTTDLARAGHAMLSSALISPALTRRWLQPTSDTSNLRNAVGRPWEIYHASSTPISPVLDIFTKSGALGPYASYFGLAPDFNVGFAILAHDPTVPDRALDLNVYADVVSDALESLQKFAAVEAAARFVGAYGNQGGDVISLNLATDVGPGIRVEELRVQGVDLKADVAARMGIDLADLDYRLYPTNVMGATQHQWVAVFQDMSALADMGTPTCITWQTVGALGADVPYRFVFELDESGVATEVAIQEMIAGLARVEE